MARKRDAAYGAPQEEREVVVSIDRRVLFGGGLGLLAVAALGVGFWWAQRGAPAGPMTAAAPGGPAVDAQATAAIQQQMQALGLPTGAVVVEPIVHATEIAPVATPGSGFVQENAAVRIGGTITPVSPEQAQLMKDFGGTGVEFKPDRPDISGIDSVGLANFEDPNVTNPDYVPAHPEAISEPLEGPRLGIADLNFINTYNYGKVPMDVPAARDFTMVNVGDADLVVSRIYTGCGCTATRLGDVFLDNAGYLPDPMTLKPGESQVFTVEFDPRLEGKPGAQAKFIQIFSNDPTKAQFSESDPYSHETRFRIVVEPAYDVKAEAGAKVFKVVEPITGDTFKPGGSTAP